MARIHESEIERLKAEVSVQRLVEARGIDLVRHGADWLGRWPFHADKTPSLAVSPAKNLWHCLGVCQIGGGPIDWVMKAEGVSFRHAVELLREGMPAVSTGDRVVHASTVPVAGWPPARMSMRRAPISSPPPARCHARWMRTVTPRGWFKLDRPLVLATILGRG